MNYIIHILVILEIYILLALSINQLTGLSGLLSLAQAFFYGMGAYTVSILITKFGFNYWTALILIIPSSIIISILFSFIANRVKDFYFGLATLAIQIIFYSLIYNWIPLTNGPFGISGIPPPKIFGLEINEPIDFAVLGGIFVVLTLTFYICFLKTALCWNIKATRDDQLAILSLGKNPNFYNLVSITISAILSALAGSLYAIYTSYIDPTSFTLDESILILSIILIGGSGGIIGPITGALIYILIPELLKFIQLPEEIAANMKMILFSLLLILIIKIKPKGLFGKYIIQ